MKKKYVKPSATKKFVQRYKRNAPSFAVDAVDFLHRLPDGGKLKYPYCGNLNAYQPFFIIGSGRSGNTLLRKLLMERAGVVIPPEIPGLGSTIRRFSQLGSKSWPEIVDGVCSEFQRLANTDVETTDSAGNPIVYNLSNELNIRFDKVKKELETISESERSLEKIVSAIYQDYSLRMFGENLPWGDKTPWNVFHYDRVKKVYPEARYIHMLRDGRDCVASYVDSLGELMGLDYADAAYRWRDSIGHMGRIERENHGKFLEVRYEDLVSSPDKTISKVISFLGVSPVDYSEVGVDMLGDGLSIHHKNLSSPVTNNSVGRWKTALSEDGKKLVLKLLSKDLKRRGYLL